MSAYRELIKNFERIRAYMREFYVYGFKSRDDYDRKSKRSYDDERRRMESWLGDYMNFVRTPDGKNVFISVDSRSTVNNPFYRAWKAKSFTDGDITLHFILFDILCSPDISLGVDEILSVMDEKYLSHFCEPVVFDESTVRKKLKEYCAEGILICKKQGRKTTYSRSEDPELCENNGWLDFFSEIVPCGVIGSFILDKLPKKQSPFSFKHHYLTSALDSEVTASLFDAMRKKAVITVMNHAGGVGESRENRIIPLRIYISTQSGRQHLIAYQPAFNCIKSFRVDYLSDVKVVGSSPRFDELREKLSGMCGKMWGVQTEQKRKDTENLQHIEFTVRVDDDEKYIINRLVREKRCGTVTKLDEHNYRFHADVYDANEMVTWLRTFICRICDLEISDKSCEKRFMDDLEKMYAMYGVKKEADS